MNDKNGFATTVTIVALVSSLLLSLMPAQASTPVQSIDTPPRFLRIPVFFITDRNLAPPKGHPDVIDFGPHRKYIGDCKHDPYMGTAYCVMPNVEGKRLDKHLSDLGWASVEGKQKEGDFKATLLPGDNFESIEKSFYGKIRDAALLTPDRNIFVFAHGYKNSFKSALHTAAKMEYYAERPLIFYSWPSVCKFRSYTSDENNCEWSQEHFNEVVNQLDSLCTQDPSLKVRLMAHSMGTRLTVRACPFLREKPWLVEADLICPDIDDGLVKHYAKRYLSANGKCVIRVYMSQRDKALAISQILHGGYNRFGECADSISAMASGVFKGNSAADKDAKDDAELAEVLEKTKHRMQTIDFTNIDSGPVGHKVPAKLICSMSFTDHPCAGLQLVPEEGGQRSKLSGRISKFTKLRNPQELSIKGTCLRVVKLGKNYEKQIAKIPVPQSP
jgi:hypothetical protein